MGCYIGTRRGNEEENERLFMHLVYLFRNEMLRGVSAGERRDRIRDQAEEEGLDAIALDRTDCALRLFRACQRAIDAIRARGNAAIVFVNFVITCMEITREQKQQIG